MTLASNHDFLLRSTMLYCGLCLIISCSMEEEIQPARLIKAHAFDKDTLDSYPLLNGGGILGLPAVIELVFDKPVLNVSINTINAQPDAGTPATVWQLEVTRYVWDNLKKGLNPQKNVVTLTITYEDETGVQKEKLDAKLGVYQPPVPPAISQVDPSNNEIDVDSNRLNREGIKITFDKQMDTQRTRIVVYHRFPNPVAFERGQRILHWEFDWTYEPRTSETTVTLLPKSKDDRLLPGHEYEVRLLAVYDIAGHGRGPEEGPLVIQFRTASEEQ